MSKLGLFAERCDILNVIHVLNEGSGIILAKYIQRKMLIMTIGPYAAAVL
jgi:hypothetical protein